MNLFYIANSRMPTEKAHGINIMEMCQAFANEGVEVTLILPKRKNLIEENIFSYYGIKENFKVEYISIFDFTTAGFFGYWFSQLQFSLILFFKKWALRPEVIFTRDELSGWLLRWHGFKVFYDMHGFPESWKSFWKIVMSKMNGIVCTNQWKLEQCHKFFGIKYEKMILARNGFNPVIFNIEMDKTIARKKVGLPLAKSLVVYTGHFYDWKGVKTLFKLAELNKDVLFVFIGGTKVAAEKLMQKKLLSGNLLFLGQQPHLLMPYYLKSADILALPNSALSQVPRFRIYSTFDTSPIKMFEYMASGVPILASDLPAIREVLNENLAFLVTPDGLLDWSNKISYILAHPTEAQNLAIKAKEAVISYSWQNRAKKIISFIKSS